MQNPRKFSFLLTFVFFFAFWTARAQCKSVININLQNNRGGFFVGQKVTLISKVDSTQTVQLSGARGDVSFTVPCNELFTISIANHTKKFDIESPDDGGSLTQNLSYSPDMIQKEKLLAMSDQEKQSVDKFFSTLRDTTIMPAAVMPAPRTSPDYYSMVMISIRNINNAPLTDERFFITGRKRGKTIRATTDKTGRIITYLPKGDTYDVHFKYNRGYYAIESTYSKGTSDIKVGFSYLGTKEIEKRQKEEELRLKALEERIKKEKEEFDKKCRELGLTLEECHKRELEELLKSGESSDTVIRATFRRNNWQDMLVVCDVTGSMAPYMAQVALWYRLSLKKTKELQFVFFNDGDGKSDEEKKIGSTGGIYHTKTTNVDSLDTFMTDVQARGYGGDTPENNIEALLKGTKAAAPFKELVMIADNYASVKDISLLSTFKVPVHIILCGSENQPPHPDYLKIAWKTKGTIHTIEQDITTLARLSEGQQIQIGSTTFKIMGGDFIELR